MDGLGDLLLGDTDFEKGMKFDGEKAMDDDFAGAE